ncbi:hypothetical protein TREMEDRAFT_65593 [Tremella mesenterica DSM 1558]|uniref:uncharacterized protein n=1 Tax=Tremella mesenterica (strain ATCC 24925 / CBS 8224 / DSM 1558 / NBRC 9311 / NRRL Y-6157 / RJB 2259-6 / UBC 559-6) TaxID=578456 RepID=UPI00032B93E0|nr:uncharacterized protein TREMEDRAFT_65593 [Tremella mesenterica DSM 1558]EIW66322.1 hypothetical protein TREMEDRAFT_65593 [Tremella mesenterica DSM 1558]
MVRRNILGLFAEIGILQYTSPDRIGSSNTFPKPAKMLHHTTCTIRAWQSRKWTIDNSFLKALSDSLLAGIVHEASVWDFEDESLTGGTESQRDDSSQTMLAKRDYSYRSFEIQPRLEALEAVQQVNSSFLTGKLPSSTLQREYTGRLGWLYLRSGGLSPAEAKEWHSRHPLPSPINQSYLEETDVQSQENKGKQIKSPIPDLGGRQGGGTDDDTVTQVVVSHNPRESGGVRSLLRRGKAFMSRRSMGGSSSRK